MSTVQTGLSDISDEQMWWAVLSRDARYDGRFVYAVRSTGVFCRPGCPSKRPGRSQAAFFSTANDAQAAGFRACRRCQPDRLGEQKELVRLACEYITGSSKATAFSTQADVSEALEFRGLSWAAFQRLTSEGLRPSAPGVVRLDRSRAA